MATKNSAIISNLKPSTYAYDDFQKALDASGRAGEFSAHDLTMAQQYPDYGMGILNYKNQYAGATNAADRQAANAAAEALRSTYGNYTGGANGSALNYQPNAPMNFSYADAPSYNYDNTANPYYDAQQDYLNTLRNYGQFEYDPYESKYQGHLDNLLQKQRDYPDWSYDPDTDPAYIAAAQQHNREGDRAARNALAQASSLTGGIPSSYAASAGAQAQNYWNSQLMDKLGEYQQFDYARHQGDFNMLNATIGSHQSMENMLYNQYDANRNVDYNAWSRYYDMQNQGLSQVNNMANSYDDRSMQEYMNALNQYNTDRNFSYGQFTDNINNDRYRDELAYAREQDALNRQMAMSSYSGGGGTTPKNNGGSTTTTPTSARDIVDYKGGGTVSNQVLNLYAQELAALVRAGQITQAEAEKRLTAEYQRLS